MKRQTMELKMPKMLKVPKGKWYYNATTNDFDKFIFVPNGATDNTYGDHGPFNSFADAKQDAIEYCRVDIREARKAIKEIENIKLSDVLGG